MRDHVKEQLVKAGAFDFDPLSRKAKFEAVEGLIAWAHRVQAEAAGGQANLFGEESFEAFQMESSDDEWARRELLANEKEVLGFYVSGHPLDTHRELFQHHTTCDSAGLANVPSGSEVLIGGQIQSLRNHITAKGKPMAFVCLEDLRGFVDLVVFPKTLE